VGGGERRLVGGGERWLVGGGERRLLEWVGERTLLGREGERTLLEREGERRLEREGVRRLLGREAGERRPHWERAAKSSASARHVSAGSTCQPGSTAGERRWDATRQQGPRVSQVPGW
jgi:hypothetical protein